jgi:uncharacterized membrane protein YdjX (TVP38/TMEM64 family)|eukprot:SAG25_NODE_172_length_13022_cov_64.797500_11_plen_91_part_00
MLVYCCTFTLFLVLCAPSTPFELVAGFVYPFGWALVLNFVGKWAGSVACFLLGRRFGAATRSLMGGGGGEAVGGGAGAESMPALLAELDR